MGLLGDFVGNTLGLQSGQEYLSSVNAASKLRDLQRRNQAIADMRDFAQPEQSTPVDSVEAFNPDDSSLSFDNLQQPGLRDIPPPPKPPVDQEGGVAQGMDQADEVTTEPTPKRDSSGNIIMEPSADGRLGDAPTLDTPDPFQDPANETSLLPDLGPELPDLSSYNKAARAGEVAKRKNLQTSLTDIMKSAGIRRKAGIAGRNVTKEQGDAYKWWSSDDAFRLFYNNPRLLDEARRDPIGFAKRYSSQQPQRTQSDIAANSGTRTKKLIDGRIEGLKTQIDGDKVQEVYRAANEIGIDPFAAIAIFGIESDFGRATGKSAKGAVGGMQVMPEQFNRLKKWFADPANLDQIKNAFRMPNGEVNMARVEYAIQTFSNMQQPGSRGRGTPNANIYAGLAQLVYNKAIGLPKNLWGAGYQGNANEVLAAGRPLMVDDGNISNSDYNRAYVSLYNHIQQTYGLKLSEIQTPYGIDLNTIAGSGVGQPVMTQVEVPSQDSTRLGFGDLLPNQGKAGVDTGQTSGYDIRQEDGPVVYKDGMPVARFTGPDGQALAEQFIAEQTGTTVLPEIEVTGSDGTKTPSIANDNVDPDETTIPKFLQDPPKIGIEMRNLLKQRQLQIDSVNTYLQITNNEINRANAKAAEYDRYAQIALANGQIADFERYKGLAEDSVDRANALRDGALAKQDEARIAVLDYDNKMLLVQGARALQDLSYGSTARAGQVLSAFTGLNIQVVPRSDGKFDITIDGNPQGSPLTYNQLADKLQSTYSSAFRENKQKRAAKRSDQVFEKNLDIAFELKKIEAELTKDVELKRVEGIMDILKEEAGKQGQIISLGEGKALIRTKDGKFIYIDPKGRVRDPNAEDGYSRGFERRIISQDEADAVLAGSGDPYKTK